MLYMQFCRRIFKVKTFRLMEIAHIQGIALKDSGK